MVAHIHVVAQKVAGPDQQIVEFGPAFGASLFSVFEGELTQGFEYRQQGFAAGPLEEVVGGVVQVPEQVLQGSAGVLIVYGIPVPVGLPAVSGVQREHPPDQAVGGR